MANPSSGHQSNDRSLKNRQDRCRRAVIVVGGGRGRFRHWSCCGLLSLALDDAGPSRASANLVLHQDLQLWQF
jgi:hypothetical protein